jgi:hypothetical protein
MPIRTSHTGDKRAAGTRLSLNGLAGASCVVRRCAPEVRPARTEPCRQPGPRWALGRGAPRGQPRQVRAARLKQLDEQVLRIERAVQRASGQLRFVEPKSLRARRVPPVPQVAMVAFNAHRARQARERLAAGDGWHDGDLIFASAIGTPMEPRNVNRRFNEPTGDVRSRLAPVA